MEDLLVLLAKVSGLRSRAGGKNQRRYSAPDTQSPGTRFAVERSRYARTETSFRSHIQGLFKQMTDGDIGLATFYQTFSKDLYKYQTTMYLLGRRAVGREDSQLDDTEVRRLHGLHSQEMKYFNGFIRDYLKGTGKMPYNQRLDLYALGGYEVYMLGALSAVPFAQHMRFPWMLNPEAEHCPDCLWKKEESDRRGGFTVDELINEIGLPGQRCQCLHRCRCHVAFPGARKQLPRTRPTAFKTVKIKRPSYAITKPKEPAKATTRTGNQRRGS